VNGKQKIWSYCSNETEGALLYNLYALKYGKKLNDILYNDFIDFVNSFDYQIQCIGLEEKVINGHDMMLKYIEIFEQACSSDDLLKWKSSNKYKMFLMEYAEFQNQLDFNAGMDAVSDAMLSECGAKD